MPRLTIAPGTEGEGGGPVGGARDPNDDIRLPERMVQSRGFLALAFGFALGLTLMILFLLLRWVGFTNLVPALADFLSHIHPNIWFTFLFGFILGTLFSAIYNFLMFQRINLFGLDREVN